MAAMASGHIALLFILPTQDIEMARNTYMIEKSKIDKEISKLMKRAEALQDKERKPVLNSIVASMREYSITPEEVAAAYLKKAGGKSGALRGAASKRTATSKKGVAKPVAAKYRDTETGKEWSGRGKPPRWITDAEQSGKSRDAFLIQSNGNNGQGSNGQAVAQTQTKSVQLETQAQQAQVTGQQGFNSPLEI